MLPHSWILKNPELVGTATNIIELLKKSMLKLEKNFINWEEHNRES